MTKDIDWSAPDTFKVERSEKFWLWGRDSINIYQKSGNRYVLVLPDFSPRVLRWCKFPKLLCEAAELTVEDGRVRLIGQNEIIDLGEKVTLVTRKPKPKLIIRRKG